MPSYTNPYMQTVPSVNSYAMNPGYLPTAVPMPQQSYAPSAAPMASNVLGYQVDGEIGAKAFTVPSGTTGPIALWDLNDNVVYMRTYNAAGIPNPLRKLRYVEEEIAPALPIGQSGGINPMNTDQFVTKNDFEMLKQEIQQLSNAMQSKYGTSGPNNQNGNNNRNNNGMQGRQS